MRLGNLANRKSPIPSFLSTHTRPNGGPRKFRGRTRYFGPWRDWQGAYEKYLYDAPYLLQGKTPPPQGQDSLTVGELVNRLLEHREAKVETGELAQRTWDDYKRTGEFLVASLGRHISVESLGANDFHGLRKKLAATRGLVALGNEIGRCRVIFTFAFKNDLIDRPVKMGVSGPKRKSLFNRRNKVSDPIHHHSAKQAGI